MKHKKIRRTRAGFGMNKPEKHAENIAERTANHRERTNLRARFKDYMLKKRDEQKKKKELLDKPITVPNRKQLRAGMAKDRRARRSRREA